ncbi:MAG: GNAT family N-acetyltransferase [Austwickia sp.]|nr:GNAT family N-acetyltransferase [Austwickia sp.]
MAVGHPALLPLGSRADLLDVVGDDPFVRYDVRPDPDRIWTMGDAAAVTRVGHRGQAGLSVWVRPADDYTAGARLDPPRQERLDALLGALLGPGGPERGASWVSVPLGSEAVLARHARLGGGGDWEWMIATAQPPAYGPEDDLVTLDDATDAAEITALAARENPRFEGEPGTGRSERWLGVREEGRLVACGTRHRTGAGAAHLSGILVAAAARGRGYGRAITGALTRESVRSEGVCTLGMYADSHPARALYHSLGYRTAHAWASRRLLWD